MIDYSTPAGGFIKSSFANYTFEYDDRKPIYYFNVPLVGTFAFTNLSFIFWVKSFLLFSVQSVINLLLAFFVHKFIVQKRRENKRTHAYLIGYGVLFPVLLCGPLYIFERLEFKNVAFMLLLVGAIPNLLLLRVVEAMHGLLPAFAEKSIGNFVLYYAATLQVMVNEKTMQPVPFTRRIFWYKLRSYASTFLQTSFLFSILLPFDYNIAPRRDINTIIDLYYWGNIVNAFLMASLTSLLLDGGASGLGLLTSICSGVTLQSFSDSPISQSSSPSDFWGNRWDRPVASGLKRGAFVPLRKVGCNRHVAAALTFMISGLIHEYVLLFMAQRHGPPYNNPQQVKYEPTFGKHSLFFVWNGIVLLLERALEGHPFIKWMGLNLPKQVRTALVLLTVLPIAHLFTDEYVKSCFFSDTAFAFPRITYLGTSIE